MVEKYRTNVCEIKGACADSTLNQTVLRAAVEVSCTAGNLAFIASPIQKTTNNKQTINKVN
jgi:hypothetical protein